MAALAPQIDETEAHLVGRAQKGDRAALDELYRRHAHPAWRLALAVGGSTAVAEHAVINGFGGVLRRLHKGTTTLATPFRLQVARASAEVAANAARRDGAPVDPPANDVIAAFRRLPDRWRAALWLTLVEGGTTTQVAPIVGLSAEAATNLVARAEAGFRERCLRTGDRTIADLTEIVPELRALVVPLPDGLCDRLADRWAAWQEEVAKDDRHGLAAVLPLGPWGERAVAGAAAAVFAGGLACAIALSSKPAHAGPQLAAPAASGELASGSIHNIAYDPFAATPSYGSSAGARAGAAATGTAASVSQARSLSGSSSGFVTPPVGTLPRSAPAAPSSPAPSSPATSDPSAGDPSSSSPSTPPADSAPPTTDPSVGASTDVAGTPIAVQVGTDGSGATVGDTTVGDTSSTSSTSSTSGTTVTIDTGGLLPTITYTLG